MAAMMMTTTTATTISFLRPFGFGATGVISGADGSLDGAGVAAGSG
jgi:hypothetical protein